METKINIAKSLLTNRCLIAADVDKTYVSQGNENEREQFLLNLSPLLTQAACLGTNMAVLTGNSMHELSSRFLIWMLEQLCLTNNVECIDRIHFFCNSGGIYVHFSKELIKEQLEINKLTKEDLCAKLIMVDNKGKMQIKPEFIEGNYIEKTRIIEEDKNKITKILGQAWLEYIEDIKRNINNYIKRYYIYEDPPKGSHSVRYELSFSQNDNIHDLNPIDERIVTYGNKSEYVHSTVQITLKPILSWRHAKNPAKLFCNDLRSKVINNIQANLDKNGLSHYVARPGGRSSIDVTLEKLDKAYALEYLIDKLNLAGSPRLNEKYGSNAIYLGDEVLSGGGNDYPVTRIPGMLVLAVNPEPEFVPFLSGVIVPSTILYGPNASSEVISEYNVIAQNEIEKFLKYYPTNYTNSLNAINLLKKKYFSDRIKNKISKLAQHNYLSVSDLQTLHSFVTLICRDDTKSKEWIAMLGRELDDIMELIEFNMAVKIPGQGSSHPDN